MWSHLTEDERNRQGGMVQDGMGQDEIAEGIEV